jgi:hypothetical protein
MNARKVFLIRCLNTFKDFQVQAIGCYLYHHAGSNKIPQPINLPALSPSKLVNEVVCHYKQTTEEIELATEEHPDLAQYAETHRVSLDLHNTQEVMIASAWVLLMDSTADTNKESRPLFTITGKDLTGNLSWTNVRGYFGGCSRQLCPHFWVRICSSVFELSSLMVVLRRFPNLMMP